MSATAPILLTEWIPNDHVTLDKNARFYDAANVKIDRVVFYPTTDYGAALRRLRAGELDIQNRLPQLEIDCLRANMPEILRIAPILTTEYLVANEGHKPFDDTRLREALNLALDRETLTSRSGRSASFLPMASSPPAPPIIPVRLFFNSSPCP